MDHDVLIVGGGPVGLALAGELGWRGIACTLIERGDGTVSQPKMDFVGTRTLEFCRRWNILSWVHEAGYNRAYPQDCVWLESLAGDEFAREPFPPMTAEKPLPQSPCPRGERCPQDFFDPVLARFARQFPHVSLRYGTELMEFEEKADGVVARLKHPDGNETRTRATYLVGCDGGSSTVRERLDIGMSGSPVLTHTTNIIFRCDGLEQFHDKAPAYRFIFIGPEGTWGTLVAINGRDRWRLSLVGNETRRRVSEAEVRQAVLRAMGRPFDFEILSIMPWVRRELVADRYGTARVFIAGDAAHVMSPTGGFGMNTGIQDAVDLGWKLEAAIRGWAGPGLLPSYEIERRPVALRNVREATGNLWRMLMPRDSRPGQELSEPGLPDRQSRRAFGQYLKEEMRREWFTADIHLGYVYENSPLIVPDGTPPPRGDASTYVQTARPGSRAPHVWIRPDQSTLDLFGRDFVLLRLGADAPTGATLEHAAWARGIPYHDVAIEHAKAGALYARRFVLVRPDGHVAWRGDDPPGPDEAQRMIDRICGDLPLPL
jgi:2-polyprenyl-6-methoxyphenol hydroxylase-like FAD-dependent oxidoreductase